MNRRKFIKSAAVAGCAALVPVGLIAERPVLHIAKLEDEIDADFIDRLLFELKKDPVLRIAIETPMNPEYVRARSIHV